MRDHRFVAEHRGGPLSKHDHRLMALWAAECAEHVLATVWTADDDQGPFDALRQARAWARGEISVGDARQAAVAAHAAARESKDAAAIAAARAAGHAAATAHMADHCLGAAAYALKAAHQVGINTERERHWQEQQLPAPIRDLVLSARALRRADPNNSHESRRVDRLSAGESSKLRSGQGIAGARVAR